MKIEGEEGKEIKRDKYLKIESLLEVFQISKLLQKDIHKNRLTSLVLDWCYTKRIFNAQEYRFYKIRYGKIKLPQVALKKIAELNKKFLEYVEGGN